MEIQKITKADQNHIHAIFEALRTAFPGWLEYHDSPFGLLQFASYEGIVGSTLENLMTYVAPFAVGDHLTKEYNFQWCKLNGDNRQWWGLCHPLLNNPINLETLLNGEWNREDYDEPPTTWKIVIDSVNFIVLTLRWKKLYGESKPIPDLGTNDLELELNRREAIH